MSEQDLKTVVKAKYGAAAQAVTDGGTATCGGPPAPGESGCCGSTSSRGAGDPITSNLYRLGETADLPAEALAASLGCGNPTALADLREGETVLDLGSGGGIDVLLSAKRVGPTGKAYGLDMTDQMLALARENQRKAGVTNVEFLQGEIEQIPLPDDAVDVEPTRVYRAEDAREFLTQAGLDADAIAPEVEGKFMSAFVRARKPLAG